MIRVDVPGRLDFSKDLVAEIIATKLALEGVTFSWHLAGRETYVTVKKTRKPPAKAAFKDPKIREIVAAARALRGFVDMCTKPRVKALDAAAGSGTYPCEGVVVYLSTELSRMAYKARVGSGITTGRNVAVARVPGWNDPKTGDLVVGFSRGTGKHSEDHILEQLAAKKVSPTKITELYSERSPCLECAPKLADALTPGTPITWTIPHGPGSGRVLWDIIKPFSGGLHSVDPLNNRSALGCGGGVLDIYTTPQ